MVWRENPWAQRSNEDKRQYAERMDEWNLTGGGQRPDESASEYEQRLRELRLTGGQGMNENAEEYERRRAELELTGGQGRHESSEDYEARLANLRGEKPYIDESTEAQHRRKMVELGQSKRAKKASEGQASTERGVVLNALKSYGIPPNPNDIHLRHGVSQQDFDTLRNCRATEIWNNVTSEMKAELRAFLSAQESQLIKLARLDKKLPEWRECGEAGINQAVKLIGFETLEEAFATPTSTFDSLGIWLAGKLAKEEINEIYPSGCFGKIPPENLVKALVETVSETIKAASLKK